MRSLFTISLLLAFATPALAQGMIGLERRSIEAAIAAERARENERRWPTPKTWPDLRPLISKTPVKRSNAYEVRVDPRFFLLSEETQFNMLRTKADGSKLLVILGVANMEATRTIRVGTFQPNEPNSYRPDRQAIKRLVAVLSDEEKREFEQVLNAPVRMPYSYRPLDPKELAPLKKSR